ncbi:MAG: right-handed parallel beta-helix repeat-containing protein [Anaerolineales bacterium]|nr:right-handed parallel beta-helix repeat-containing protein [Anaerolineales bacterium]
MSHKVRAIFLFLTIVAVMLVSAVGTTSVYADDGTPPPPPTETAEVDPPADEGEATSEPTEAAPPATEEPVVEEPVATEPVVEEPAATEPEEAASTEEAATILEQVPDDTTVTVLNAEGEPQPLTSQESADAILTSDPIWCPQNQAPTPGANGCTDSFESFDELLDFLKANETDPAYQQAGKIYVQMGTYTSDETSIDFDSYGFTSLNNYNLTVQGGWDTSGTSINPANPTVLNVPVVIGFSNPWAGSLTFNDIQIINADGTGLTLVSNGDITLTNVAVTNSQAGADLKADGSVTVQGSQFNNNKKFGAKVNAGGFVYITDSEFNNNDYDKDKVDGYGLLVESQDEVFLDTVYANSNEKFGADITATGSVAVLNSFFNGNLSYTHNCPTQTCHPVPCEEKLNGGYGIKIVSDSTAYLDGVEANENYLFGADIEAVDAWVLNSYFNHNWSRDESNPQGYGLQVQTTGGDGVTLESVHADNNQLFGANITAGEEGVVVYNSFFDGNKSYYKHCVTKYYCHPVEECTEVYDGYGLQVVTTGNINVSDVSAQGNLLFGAHLDGSLIGISNSIFSGNGSGTSDPMTGRGLEVISTDSVTLDQVAASNNQLFGADIQAVGDVTLSRSAFNGHMVYTYSGNCTAEDMKTCLPQPCVKTLVGGGYGLQVVTDGAINLAGVEANDNYLFGTRLVGSSVKIAGYGNPSSPDFKPSTFNRNKKEGLIIESQGTVTLANVFANYNSLAGATILSGLNESKDGTVIIADSFFTGNSSYTYSYCKGKTFSGYGLKIVTTGDYVSLTNVEANDNYLFGAHIEGADIDISKSFFSSNGTDNPADHVGKGLEIISTEGQVTLSEVTASDNQLFGANIQANGYVSVTDSFFNGNKSYCTNCGSKSSGGGSSGGGNHKTCHNCTTTYDGYGLQVVTTGNIYVGNVKAEGNYLFGAHLEGAQVDVYDSSFSSNVSPTQKDKTPTGRGLEVKSTGNTTLQGVTANDNQLFGADIESGGTVTIISSLFNNNKYYICTVCGPKKGAGYGLKVVTTNPDPLLNTITLNGVEALENGAEGAILDGESAVQVTDSSFNNNGANGLTVTANGDITLTNVTATGNKGNGVEATGVCTNTVHVDGGTFAGNSKYGLKVVNATYDEVNPPSYGSGNGSGNLFTDSSTCVSGDDDDDGGDGGSGSGGSSGGHHGWNWWYWWWFWHHGFGRR